jgi:pyruvate dehydrogenase E1 component alpha subunit
MSRTVLEREPDDKIEVLAPDGSVLTPELVPDLSPEELLEMYRDMKFCRRFD